MVDGVVHQVAAERIDAEPGAVAAATLSLPLPIVDPLEGFGQPERRVLEFGGHDRRVLPVVVVLNRRGVLVPVGIGGIVQAQHEVEALVIEATDVAHVAGVFQG